MCALVCANCHAEIRAGLRPAPTSSTFDEALFRRDVKQPRINGRFASIENTAAIV